MTDVREEFARRVRDARGGLRLAWDVTRTAVAPIARRAPEIVVVIAVTLSVLAVLVLVGAARNDATIDADRGVSVGEVLDGSDAGRTFVRFTASDGAVLTPDKGVFYPRGLEPGNYVLVEYDKAQPELVRVAGRDWTEGLAPVAGGIVGVWVLLGPLAWWLRRRRDAAADPTGPDQGPDDASTTSDPDAEVPDEAASDDSDREPVGASR